MLTGTIIGNIGANARIMGEGGSEFVTFRVASNKKWTDQQGQVHSVTDWVDCTLNGRPAVTQYLTAGALVYVEGELSTRVYSSERDRCMKAGLKIAVRRVELLGGKVDAVPPRLVDANGNIHEIIKYYHCSTGIGILTDTRGNRYGVDDKGWVVPYEQIPANFREQAEGNINPDDNGTPANGDTNSQ